MASREQDKPSAELLRRSLATAARAEDACPEPEILAAYSEHTLAADETARYDLHLSSCPRCREQLAAMARASGLAGAAGKDRARTPGAAWFWDWRRLAPAAAALVVVVVLLAQFPRQRHQAEESSRPLVAMSQPTEPPPALPAPQSVPPTRVAPARVAPPSAPVVGGALQRTAPDLSSAKNDFEPPQKPSVPQKKESVETSDELQSSEREYARSAKLKTPAVAPQAAAPASGGDTCPSGAICDAGVPKGVGSVSDSVVEVTSAAPLISTAPPVSQGLTDSTTADAGVNSVGPESARAKQVPAPALVNRAPTLSQSVVLEATADRYPQTIVRSPDPQVLWRVSSGRVVERSSDAGATWREQWTNASARIVAGAAPSADTCWLVGRGGIVLLTTDGKNWKTIAPPATADFVSVSVDGASSATVTASDGRQYTTSDGGKRWIPAP
jgi:hypothetical protein